jgi:guanyl-specific ribonuclease Sa
MGTRLEVESEHYAAASSLFGDIADQASLGVLTLTTVLDACEGMAGDDPAGQSWAASYDSAAWRTVQTSQDVINGCYRLAALLQQTGFNYAAAESASTPGLVWSHPDTTRWASVDISVAPVASSSGAGLGAMGTPPGFSLVSDLVDAMWPNGHQDRLHRAADAWTNCASMLETLGDATWQAVNAISLLHTPETSAALTAVHAMRSHLFEVARVHRSLAAACRDFAHHLDEVHSSVIGELESLLAWTAAIEAGGALLSVFTFGLAEAPTQAVEASRFASTAATITAIINRLTEVAAAASANMAAAADSVVVVGLKIRYLLDARLAVAQYEVVRGARLVYSARSGAAVKTLGALGVRDLALFRVPPSAREVIALTLERARVGKIRFQRHDGKVFENELSELPRGVAYEEWTIAANGAKRGADRLIISGDPAAPSAIYYWDHTNPPIWIGPWKHH